MHDSLRVEDAKHPFGLVGSSPAIQRVLRQIKAFANTRWPVLVLGETGTGKELAARALHAVSPGSSGAFVAVDSASLPATLAESMLFGHCRGTFTGAAESRRGLFEQAQGGTLFLDEIGELPLEIQPKLLRALQEKEIRPLGSNRTVKLDVRIIAATNRDLVAEVKAGRFRADLLYRLNILNLSMPPLRDRKGDIPLLIQHFLECCGAARTKIPSSTIEGLMAHDWPGNVRELENWTLRFVAMGAERDDTAALQAGDDLSGSGQITFPTSPLSLADVEAQAVAHALRLASGDRRRAAAWLGIGRTTIYRKLRRYRCNLAARGVTV